jgi:hypothetical protein
MYCTTFLYMVNRYFDHRYRAFKRVAMKKCPEAMGCLTDDFDRCEFQHRGSCHIHGAGWSADQCPLYDGTAATSDAICAFADKYITCARSHPLVPEEVMKVQHHRHKMTCFKHGYCRFGYPRPPIKYTIILTPFDDTKGEVCTEVMWVARRVSRFSMCSNGYMGIWGEQLSLVTNILNLLSQLSVTIPYHYVQKACQVLYDMLPCMLCYPCHLS